MADDTKAVDTGASLQITVADDQTNKPQPTGDKKTDDNRPAWLPEKFKTPEEMAKAYAELEQKQGKGTPPAPPQQTIQNAGIDTAQLRQELAEKGELSKETLATLASKGIPQEMADAFVKGVVSDAKTNRAKLTSVAGGEDKLKSVYEWAGANLSPGDLKAYNALVEKGDFDAAALALGSIVSKYTEATGKEPNLLSGDGATGGDGAKYESEEAVVKAMQDPRYQYDPAYRREVAQKLARSPVFVPKH